MTPRGTLTAALIPSTRAQRLKTGVLEALGWPENHSQPSDQAVILMVEALAAGKDPFRAPDSALDPEETP